MRGARFAQIGFNFADPRAADLPDMDLTTIQQGGLISQGVELTGPRALYLPWLYQMEATLYNVAIWGIHFDLDSDKESC